MSYIIHEHNHFAKKATNAFVYMVINDLAKSCFTTLKNQRANAISLKGNFPPKASN